MLCMVCARTSSGNTCWLGPGPDPTPYHSTVTCLTAGILNTRKTTRINSHLKLFIAH